ncbi:MAG: hypothetical protein IIV03_07135 [Clostridia bacterium]|nr:hypothetical protein [Clostridia bacterium]
MSFLYFLEGIRNSVLDALFSVITICGEETVFMAVGMIIFKLEKIRIFRFLKYSH